jgi:hypothetical protein
MFSLTKSGCDFHVTSVRMSCPDTVIHSTITFRSSPETRLLIKSCIFCNLFRHHANKPRGNVTDAEYTSCILFVSATSSSSASGSAGVQLIEYCQWETFNATCDHGSVVLMTAAQYGRMRHGRCADTDVFIGCQADVLSLMDARCSGRESCAVAIPDGTLHQQQPCPNDMMAYLEASFTCVPGNRRIIGYT